MAIFPPNTTLLFHVPASIYEQRRGIPTLNTKGLLVIASMGSKSRRETQMTDADLFTTQLTGRAVTPKALPVEIMPGAKAEAILWRVGGGFKLPEALSIGQYQQLIARSPSQILQRGQFFIAVDTGSKFGIQDILGDKINGRLVTEVAWGEPL